MRHFVMKVLIIAIGFAQCMSSEPNSVQNGIGIMIIVSSLFYGLLEEKL